MKRKQTPKAAAASKKNLAAWENKQAMMHRLSDNKMIATVFFILGAVFALLSGLIGLYISMNV